MFNNKQYWEERLKKQYDLIGVGDISLSLNYNKWSYKVTRKVLRGLMKKYTPASNDNVMDVGCGTGFVVDIWQELGKRVTGVDISATAVKKLSEKFPDYKFIEFDMGDGDLPVEDNSISCCTAASVLYHIVDDAALDQTLTNIHRVLQKDGIFIFSDNFIHDKELDVVHQKCRTLDEYTQFLERNNFEIVDRVPNYVLMNDPVDAQSKFYPRIWSRLTKYSRASKFVDSFIWMLVYPFELLLVNTLKESPAQEFMICRAKK